MCVVRLALPAALVDPRFSVYLVGVGEGRGVGGREDGNEAVDSEGRLKE